jgi:hypothetical protein
MEIPGFEARRAAPFWVETSQGHVPSERDPSARDRRFLGVFLQFPDASLTNAR